MTVQWFHGNGPAELVGCLSRFFQRIDQFPFRNRNAVTTQPVLCFVLVLRQLNCDRVGAIGHRRLNVTKVFPIAELDSVSCSIAPARYAALLGSFNNGTCRWT